MAGPFSRRPAAKPKDVGKTLKRIMKYLLAYRLQLAAVAVSIKVQRQMLPAHISLNQ